MNKIAFLFPGQGSQYIGMGKNLYENFPKAREVFEQANEALGFDLKGLCFEGNIEELTKTENAQPAILTTSVAAYEVFKNEFALEPYCMAGHSLGEFSALTCAGAIRFEDAVRIVRKRGTFMQEAVPVGVGAMAAISGVDKEEIERECKNQCSDVSIVVVSNYNSPDQIVISGHIDAVNKVGDKLKQINARVIPLKVSAPFHSPLMQPAADRLKEELQRYSYDTLKYTVVSNVSALPYESTEVIIENLVNQVVKPVRWIESMKYLENNDIQMVIELGPQAVLKNLMKKNIASIRAISYDKEDDVKTMKEEFAVVEDKKPLTNMSLKLIARCMGIAVCTKNTNWDNEVYKAGVTEPYKKIKELYEKLETENVQPTIEQMKEAINMLKSVFVTKGTLLDEQIERFNQLKDETGLEDFFSDIELPA